MGGVRASIFGDGRLNIDWRWAIEHQRHSKGTEACARRTRAFMKCDGQVKETP